MSVADQMQRMTDKIASLRHDLDAAREREGRLRELVEDWKSELQGDLHREPEDSATAIWCRDHLATIDAALTEPAADAGEGEGSALAVRLYRVIHHALDQMEFPDETGKTNEEVIVLLRTTLGMKPRRAPLPGEHADDEQARRVQQVRGDFAGEDTGVRSCS